MIQFKDCFEKIFIISLDCHHERRARLLRQLNEQGVYAPKVEVIRAVHGDSVGVPAWWRSGGGAWGCMLSHSKAIQQAVLDDLDNFLVLEDDAVLSSNFDDQLQTCWPTLPENWMQLYLGGQHLLEPIPINASWMKCLDVNRTHAYALKKEIYAKVHSHLNYAPDYMEAYNKGWHPHCDHQLGKAQRRGDWETIGMKVWLFGQGENNSWINGRWHPSKWWDYAEGDCFRFLPYVVIENDGTFSKVRGNKWRGKHRKGEIAKNLHFGWNLGPDRLSTQAAWEMREEPAKLAPILGGVAQEAFDCRRIPGFYGNQDQVDFLRMCWPGGTVTLRELEESGGIEENLEKMVDFHWNGLLDMRTRAKDVSIAS